MPKNKKIKEKIRVIANFPSAKKQAQILEALINKEYETYKGVIDAISHARLTIENIYGFSTPSILWDKIFEAVVSMEMSNLKKSISPLTKKRK